MKEIKPFATESEGLFISPDITDVTSYKGRSERIKGFQRISDAVAGIHGIWSAKPIILLEGAYQEHKVHGISNNFRASIQSIWDGLAGEQHPLIVRRLFPDEKGETQPGPRSGNVASVKELLFEVGKFYDYFDEHYTGQNVLPEIMIHSVIDTSNPPKNESPFLPYPGGDVIPLTSSKFQIRATFGADESVQGFPADIWEVTFRPDGSLEMQQTIRAKKTGTLIPAPNAYQQIGIPTEFQERPALNHFQVLALAEVCRRMNRLYGPHRLEFDGTRVKEEEPLVIIESAPFSLRVASAEIFGALTFPIINPMIVLYNEQDFDTVPQENIVFTHLPKTHFQGNERREALTRLSTIAREKSTKLIVFAAGNIATQHAVRVLLDHGHLVMFVKDEEFIHGEAIRLFTKETKLLWERENPIVFQENMIGRDTTRVGGKAVSLYKLEKHGFNIPPYFVIETSLFRRLVEDIGLNGVIDTLDTANIGDIKMLTKLLTNRILNYDGNLCHVLSCEFNEALTRIGGEKFSVRSSATCEDGRYSFAGIFKTLLNVSPPELHRAMLQVLASGVSEDAIRMARTLDIKPSQMQMAVIIQSMVDAKKAGTIFTKDHISGNEDFVRIDAVEGLGETIVDGTAKTHQSLVIDKKTGLIQQGDIYLRWGNVLTAEEIQKLVELGLEVERKLKEGPQDIEWTLDQNGQIFLLQTRPL
ncbi:hypothetical protein HYZ70_02180 [Candidatus Curtissbacteria bacterium]|nr:hypothetical protein [Candidatus Curtissbacteria bacterium]